MSTEQTLTWTTPNGAQISVTATRRDYRVSINNGPAQTSSIAPIPASFAVKIQAGYVATLEYRGKLIALTAAQRDELYRMQLIASAQPLTPAEQLTKLELRLQSLNDALTAGRHDDTGLIYRDIRVTEQAITKLTGHAPSPYLDAPAAEITKNDSNE